MYLYTVPSRAGTEYTVLCYGVPPLCVYGLAVRVFFPPSFRAPITLTIPTPPPFSVVPSYFLVFIFFIFSPPFHFA